MTKDRMSTRTVQTADGAICYTLHRKSMKHLYLRVKSDGTVLVTAPLRASGQYIDEFVVQKSAWIKTRMSQMRQRQPVVPLPPKAVCYEILRAAVLRVYPLVQPCSVAFPEIKMRKMKSQWGNCHCHQGYITLNTALVRCPEGLMDYVALHELVHFLHPNHGPGFQGAMTALMPDWKTRRAALKGYSSAIET